MKTQPGPPAQKLTKDITRVVWGMAIAWTLITAGLFAINTQQHRQAVQETAISQARTHFQKDVAFRLWAAMHGGAYVPITEQTPPNPYLTQVPERDIETPSGKKLTLMNPAYITRQVFTQFSEQYGIHEHLTSLQPLNPINSPDAWESSALASLAQGKTEVSEFIDYNGEPHLRQMQALFIQEACLKCHAQQGYKLGDVRGGISISLPMTALLAHKQKTDLSSLLFLGIIWLLGLGSLLLGEDILVRRIKERNRAIEELETTQARHKEAQRLAHLGHWEQDLTTNRLQWSDEVFHIFGKDPRSFEVSLETFINAVHPEDREMTMQAFNKAIQNKTPYEIIHRLLMEDGSMKYVHERCRTVYDDSGKPLQSLGTVQDITTRIEAERALLESEEQLQLVLRGANLGTWDWNVATGVISINDRWAEMLGYRKEEIEPSLSSWEKLVHPDDAPAVLAAHTDHFEGRTVFLEVEYRLRAKSGGWKWIHSAGQVVDRDPSGKPLRAAGIHLDITHSKELEQRVTQQERLSAIGQLTTGIAHDFNNTLTSILGFAQLLHKSREIPESARESLAIIISSGRHAADLVRQMLDFSRQSIRAPRQFDLAPLCKEIVRFHRRAIPETITIQLDIEPADYLVRADPTQIQQLLTNLLLNARDAMPDGGRLRVKLARGEASGAIQCALCHQPLTGDWVTITVSDSGSGIMPEHLSRIFEPFFTTKEVGKGSGLGLAQVFGIVKQHDAHISVHSQPERGTTFVVHLPPTLPNGHGEPAEKPACAPITQGGNETILLVEDEPTVRGAMRTMLEHLGYNPLEAANGREALDVYAAHRQDIALVLSDMVMPEMGGLALFTALREQNPGIRVVLMSGYHPGKNKDELLQQGVADWFQKPVSLDLLSRVLREALGERRL